MHPAKFELSARLDTVIHHSSLLDTLASLIFQNIILSWILPRSLTTYTFPFFFASYSLLDQLLNVNVLPSLVLNFFLVSNDSLDNLPRWLFISSIHHDSQTFPFIPEHQIHVYKCLINISLDLLIVTTNIKISNYTLNFLLFYF